MACVPYSGSGVVPGWLMEPHDSKRIGVALDRTSASGPPDDLLETVIKALSYVDDQVLIAADGDQSDLRGLPPHMRQVRGLPPSAILTGCDVIIHDGGPAKTLTALASGPPMLCLPHRSVHFQHADRVAEIGAGMRLYPERADAEAVEAAVTGMLGDATGTRAAARGVRDEMENRPRAADVVTCIEASMVGHLG